MSKKELEETKILNKVEDVQLKTPKRPKRTKWQKFRLVMAFIVCFCVLIEIIVGSIGLSVAYTMLEDKPELNVNDFISNESSIMYDKDGNTVAELGAYLRENISYDQMPESLIDAVLSIEDSRYFEHFGFDIPRFFKSGIAVLQAGDFVQGGSTLTMQLVKNTYFQTDDVDTGGTLAPKKIGRKVQEIVLAMELDNSLDKKTIFELYLNKLNFGGNIRGVQKAAEYYFGKDASELNIVESALLAGIINAPNGYNPYYYLDKATARRNKVLDMMAYHGYISDEECTLYKSISVEDQLVGKKAGDEVEVKVTFPKNYHSEKLAGQPATFDVTIHSVSTAEKQELTDEFVKENLGLESIEKLKIEYDEKLEKFASQKEKMLEKARQEAFRITRQANSEENQTLSI